MNREELKAAAVAMLDRAYVPYSRFPVGAALECADGTVFTGCNVENASYPAGLCAERNAMFHAVAEGHTDFVRIVVAGRSDDFCYPCGICRQVMKEFAPELETNKKYRQLTAKDGDEKRLTLNDLLPYGFDRTWLPKDNA